MGVSAVSLRQDERAHGHIAEQTVTIATPVAILTPPNSRTYKVVIQTLDNAISLRDDGVVASADTGLVLAAGDIYVLEANQATMLAVSAIAIGGPARIRVAYYGY